MTWFVRRKNCFSMTKKRYVNVCKCVTLYNNKLTSGKKIVRFLHHFSGFPFCLLHPALYTRGASSLPCVIYAHIYLPWLLQVRLSNIFSDEKKGHQRYMLTCNHACRKFIKTYLMFLLCFFFIYFEIFIFNFKLIFRGTWWYFCQNKLEAIGTDAKYENWKL